MTDFIKNVGLVIVDEAHYNSFRKIFQYYEDCNILGVTATPLQQQIFTSKRQLQQVIGW